MPVMWDRLAIQASGRWIEFLPAERRTKLHLDDVKREVQIMRHLNGTRNIVTLEVWQRLRYVSCPTRTIKAKNWFHAPVNTQDVYEDSTNIHLVMELCTGGELFDSISAAVRARPHVPPSSRATRTRLTRPCAAELLEITQGHFSERKAAAVFRVILEVVSACHGTKQRQRASSSAPLACIVPTAVVS